MLDAWLNTGMAEPYVVATALWGNAVPVCTAPVPALLSATPGINQVVIEWSDEHSGDSQVVGYKIYCDQAGKAQLQRDVGQRATYTDNDLTNGQLYCYKVTSFYDQSCESEYSNIICTVANENVFPWNLFMPAILGDHQYPYWLIY